MTHFSQEKTPPCYVRGFVVLTKTQLSTFSTSTLYPAPGLIVRPIQIDTDLADEVFEGGFENPKNTLKNPRKGCWKGEMTSDKKHRYAPKHKAGKDHCSNLGNLGIPVIHLNSPLSELLVGSDE